MANVIRTNNLSKHYKSFTAVDDVSLSVEQGEIYAFLGLNGAGKTTTIRMLLGMIKPSAGSIHINDRRVDAGSYDIWREVGYLVEMPYSYPDLTVYDNLEIIRQLRGLSADATDRVIQELSLTRYRNVRAKNLSLGNGQRLGLAKAFIHHPSILILDEPANGLDPAGVVEVRELLHDLATNHGATIFLSSHILGEVAQLASRVGIIHQSKLVQELDMTELELLTQKRLVVNGPDHKVIQTKLHTLGFNPKVSASGWVEVSDQRAVRHPENIARAIVEDGIKLTMIKTDEENLEHYFLRIIEEEQTGHETIITNS